MKMIAPRKTMKVTAFFRKLNCVGSAFNFVDASLMNRLIRILKIFDITKAINSVPMAITEYLIIGRESNFSIMASIKHQLNLISAS